MARDVYAISICQDWTYDPRHAWLCLGINTVEYWLEQTRRAQKLKPSEPGEAKWNVLGFWPGARGGWLAVVGESSPAPEAPDDPGIALRERWADRLGLTVSDAELAGWDCGPGIIAERIDALDRAYADLCVTTALALHESGVLSAKFGRPVPVIVLDTLRRVRESVAWTRAANPTGLAKEYEDWAASLGS